MFSILVLLIIHFLSKNRGQVNCEFSFKQEFSIQLNQPNTKNHSDVLITFDSFQLISHGKMLSNCADMMFVDSNNQSFSYWLESGCNRRVTSCWIRIPKSLERVNPFSIFLLYNNDDLGSFNSNSDIFRGSFISFKRSDCTSDHRWTPFQPVETNDRHLRFSSYTGELGGSSKHIHPDTYRVSIQNPSVDCKAWEINAGWGPTTICRTSPSHKHQCMKDECVCPIMPAEVEIPHFFITSCSSYGSIDIISQGSIVLFFHPGNIGSIWNPVDSSIGRFARLTNDIDANKNNLVNGSSHFHWSNCSLSTLYEGLYRDSVNVVSDGRFTALCDASCDHGHFISSSTNTDETDISPKHTNLFFAEATQDTFPIPGMILGFKQDPWIGWEFVGDEFTGSYPRGCNACDGEIVNSTMGHSHERSSFEITGSKDFMECPFNNASTGGENVCPDFHGHGTLSANPSSTIVQNSEEEDVSFFGVKFFKRTAGDDALSVTQIGDEMFIGTPTCAGLSQNDQRVCNSAGECKNLEFCHCENYHFGKFCSEKFDDGNFLRNLREVVIPYATSVQNVEHTLIDIHSSDTEANCSAVLRDEKSFMEKFEVIIPPVCRWRINFASVSNFVVNISDDEELPNDYLEDIANITIDIKSVTERNQFAKISIRIEPLPHNNDETVAEPGFFEKLTTEWLLEMILVLSGGGLFVCCLIFVVVLCLCILIGLSAKQRKRLRVFKDLDMEELVREHELEQKHLEGKVFMDVSKNLFEIEMSDIEIVEEKRGFPVGDRCKLYLAKWKGQTCFFRSFRFQSFLSANIQTSTLKKFEKELETLIHVGNHACIQTLYGGTCKYPELGLVLEPAEWTVQDYVMGKRGICDFKTKLRFLVQICRGLNFLHNRDIVHRDLNGCSVLVTDKIECKVSGFSVSRVFVQDEEMTRLSTSGSGQFFQSPEIVMGKQYNTRCDSFSFGMLIYAIFVERFENPFGESDHVTVQSSIQMAIDPLCRPPMSDIRKVDGCGSKLVELIEKCLESDSEKRLPFTMILKTLKSEELQSHGKNINKKANSIERKRDDKMETKKLNETLLDLEKLHERTKKLKQMEIERLKRQLDEEQ